MSAQKILLETYGEPGLQYQIKYCEIWEVRKDFDWFLVEKFLVNKDFKEKLFIAFKNLEKKNLHTEIKTFNGCYNDRSVRGKNSTSLHAWACAIDLNAKENKMIVHPSPEQRSGAWSDEFISVIKDAGIFFGGYFINRADPMHFALLNG